MPKRERMLYKCECGYEASVKTLLIIAATNCKECGRALDREVLLKDIERQRQERKQNK